MAKTGLVVTPGLAYIVDLLESSICVAIAPWLAPTNPALYRSARPNKPRRGVALHRWMPLLALALGACASGPSPAQQAADEIANVYPADAKAEIIAVLRTYLNDPTGIRDAELTAPALKPVGSRNRYVACVRFSAKKSSGGYAAPREHLVIFYSGKLERFIEASRE